MEGGESLVRSFLKKLNGDPFVDFDIHMKNQSGKVIAGVKKIERQL